MKEDQVYPLKKVSDLIEILKKFDPETNIVGGEIQKESLTLVYVTLRCDYTNITNYLW